MPQVVASFEATLGLKLDLCAAAQRDSKVVSPSSSLHTDRDRYSVAPSLRPIQTLFGQNLGGYQRVNLGLIIVPTSAGTSSE